MPKVLVIDDDEVVAFSVQNALRDYEVLATADEVEGLDLFRRYLADIVLVVLDIQMPHLDGHATCVKIRSISRSVPIIPFTGFPHEGTLDMLCELGCFAPLIKPAAPDVLARALMAALPSAPPSTPASAFLTYTRELVAKEKQPDRTKRTRFMMVHVTNSVVRRGLKTVLEKVGIRVALTAGRMSNLRAALVMNTPLAVMTVPADLAEVRNLAQEQAVPVVVLISTLAEGLAMVEVAHRTETPYLGIVIEHPFNEAALPAQIAIALDELACHAHFIPPELIRPFAATALPPQEQAFLTLEVQGLSSQDISDRLGIEASSVRQYRSRMSRRLNLSEGQTLQEWAEAWWRAYR
jgi:DNA-binding NarL/FixJ family response regulator